MKAKQKSRPEGLAILICDYFIEDLKTHKKSLIGIFNRIQSAGFPCSHPQLHVFISLTDGRGDYDAQLRCIFRETGDVCFGASGKISFPDPNAVIELNFLINNAVFPKPGPYSFEFLCNGEMVLERRFMVTKRGAK